MYMYMLICISWQGKGMLKVQYQVKFKGMCIYSVVYFRARQRIIMLKVRAMQR